METLPNDIKRLVALELSPSDLIKFCLTDKNTNNAVCNSNDFWRRKLMIDYPLVFDYYVRNKMIIKNPKNLYIRKFTEVYIMIEKFVDEEFVLGEYLTDEHEKLFIEMKDDLKKIIYSTYDEILKLYPNNLKTVSEYKNSILNRINLKYRLRYFDSLDFSKKLDKLLFKILNKDQMYGIKR